MQAHSLEVFSLAKIVFYPKKFYYPLLLPSHNCINNHNVQFSRCIFKFLFQETQWSNDFSLLQSISWMMVESTGIEPVTSCLQGRRSPSWANPPYKDCLKWWAKMDSNHRPHDYQSCALASWAIGPYLASTSFLGTSSSVPSKLNNASIHKLLYPCTDLRTLLVDTL